MELRLSTRVPVSNYPPEPVFRRPHPSGVRPQFVKGLSADALWAKMPPFVRAILSAACDKYGIGVRDALSYKRGAAYAARQEAMKTVRAMILPCGKPPSYPQIGGWFGRDHTGVMAACGAVKQSRAKFSKRVCD